jgi:hypothetical protein
MAGRNKVKTGKTIVVLLALAVFLITTLSPELDAELDALQEDNLETPLEKFRLMDALVTRESMIRASMPQTSS